MRGSLVACAAVVLSAGCVAEPGNGGLIAPDVIHGADSSPYFEVHLPGDAGSSGDSEADVADGETRDAAVSDVLDASAQDTSVPDTSVPDKSVPDTSVPDTSVPDAAAPDSAPQDTEADAGSSGDSGSAADAGTSPDAGAPPKPKPKSLKPCSGGKCWLTPTLSGLCGSVTINEDYSTGKYNVHRYAFAPKPAVDVDITVAPVAGGFKPAVILHDGGGKTLFDGVTALAGSGVVIKPLANGKNGKAARLRLKASKAANLRVHLTDWSVVAGGFKTSVSKAAKYKLTVSSKCPPPSRESC